MREVKGSVEVPMLDSMTWCVLLTAISPNIHPHLWSTITALASGTSQSLAWRVWYQYFIGRAVHRGQLRLKFYVLTRDRNLPLTSTFKSTHSLLTTIPWGEGLH